MEGTENDRGKLLRSLSLDREEFDGDEVSKVRPNWLFLLIAGLVGIILGAGIVSAWSVDESEGSSESEVAEASSSTNQSQPAAAEPAGLVASGYVVARNQATVAAQVTGRITEIRIEEGQSVTRGQILAVLDRDVIASEVSTASARLASSRSNLDALKAELKEAEADLGRAIALDERGFVTKAELGRKQASVDSLGARIRGAKADILAASESRKGVQNRAEQYFIRAPFSGVVVGQNAQVGEVISPISAGGGFTRTGICTIVDMSSLEIEVDVNEQYIERVAVGQAAEVSFDAYPSLKADARVIAIVPTVDRARSTLRVRIAFDETNPRFIPNLSVKVQFRPVSETRNPNSDGA
ncbi:efflux RND transporter periplasmic adaptor subunit [Erythrobacter crassostreae]|uniref:Efflux RND transporter periplasmic adaptor subunit n=1 Tax=Erythrobacter crassostreae TaxID=2828328 RepID=A0A9X1F4X8_9SPHN|nr:efflux RND transporter periplasmic adaptor subunit [Erythrobacter crassostrea]MBV7260310.1 efflux RND transporter periplasmic adaptor subunit [Erythrobacter crassostrea]